MEDELIRRHLSLLESSTKERLCEVCGRRPALYKCPRCGRLVCEKCYDWEKNFCFVCSATLCEVCRKKHATEVCQVCGKAVCPSCLVRVDKSRVACRECFGRLGKDGVISYIKEKIERENRSFRERMSPLSRVR